MEKKHLDVVVCIHVTSFPEFFSTLLGSRYIRVVYAEILEIPEHVAFVALDNISGEVIGFINGFTQQTHFYRHMARKKWLPIAVACLSAVVRYPQIIGRLFRAFTYPHKSQKAAADALLLSVAVLPSDKGRGVGEALVDSFLDEMKKRGTRAVCLTTDQENNEHTNRFYLRLGFGVVRTYTTAEGRQINEYLIDLTKSEGHDC